MFAAEALSTLNDGKDGVKKMSQDLFRKVSLDRLSSPEELDRLITVTSPKAWLSLIGIGCVLITALIWSIYGNIATKVQGEGILISNGGIHSVVHSQAGQISDVSVRAGDYVKKGDVVARISQDDIIEKISDLKSELIQVESLDLNKPELNGKSFGSKVYNEISQLVERLEDAKANLQIQQASYNRDNTDNSEYDLERAKLSLEQAAVREQEQRNQVELKEKLYIAGAISKEELDDEKNTLKQYELETKVAEQTLKEAGAGPEAGNKEVELARLNQAKTNVDMITKELSDKIIISRVELKAEIEELKNAYEHNSAVIASIDGRVLEVNVRKGDFIQAGMQIVSVSQENENDRSLEYIIYIPVEQGKKVLPGMEVQISPTTVNKEEYGYLLGKVVSVSEYPSSQQNMQMTLGNETLVGRLSGQGAPIEVHIDLITDNTTQSGYKWSTPKGEALAINEGTICIGEITIEKQKPITMVIPYIRKKLGI